MLKLKNIIKKLIKKNEFFYRLIRKIYTILKTIKYRIINYKTLKKENKHYSVQVNNAIKILQNYAGENYLVFYNPTWLGVANSTKGLFKNIVPLEHIHKKKDIQKLSKAIVDNDIKLVVFSQICDGWTEIIQQIKELNKKTIVKVIWHGNCYEYFSDFTWNLNKKVMKLYKENKIDSFGFVRSTMYEFYKKVGFKSFYLQNNIHAINIKKINKPKNDKIKVGIYNADTRELKNIYTSLSSIKLITNGVADVVPINEGAKEFAKILNLETSSINYYIPTKDLLKRIQTNDINLYPTFTENAPMFPLESFEMGVPCLVGNNNDYFVKTKLGEYVILTREDDPEYIKEKILNCIANKEEIMSLYKDWKKEFDVKCEELVNQFIKI